MYLMIVIVLAALFLLPFPVLAEIKIVTHTVQQPFGGSQSPDDARIAGIARAKREALERFGTYIESTTVVKDSRLDSDEILALTAGVTKAEVIKQKNYTDGDGFGLEITVKVELDSDVLDQSLKRLLQDRIHLKELKAARVREKQLLARIAEMEKLQKLKGGKQTASQKREFKKASQGLTAIEWYNKAMTLWDGIKYSEPAKAIEYLTQSIQHDSDSAYVYTNRGVAYHSLKQYQQAISDFSQAIKLDSGTVYAYNNRGTVYADLKKYQLAISDYTQAIQISPNLASAYNNRGHAYNNLSQYQLAISDLNKAIQLDNSLAAAYNNRANAYDGLKQYQLAINDYTQSIQLTPSDAEVYINRGISYLSLNQFQQAINDFNQAIEHDPSLAAAYHNRGVAHFHLNLHQQAFNDYTRAIQLDPGFAEPYNNRGQMYLLSKDEQKGCLDLATACNLGVCDKYVILCGHSK